MSNWTIFLQIMLVIIVFLLVAILIIRWLSESFDVESEEVISKIEYFDDEVLTCTYWKIKRTYKSGRVEWIKREM